MERAAHDNELLAACKLQRGFGLYCLATGFAIGCVWYLCVCFRAGVLQ